MSKSKLLTFTLIFLSFSAIFSFYNFKSASAYTGNVIYNSNSNTLYCYGGSASNPMYINDVYEASIATNLTVIEKQGDNQFLFKCFLVAGNYRSTYTYLNITDVQITFQDGLITSNGQNLISNYGSSTSYSFVSIGNLINKEQHLTNNGAQIIDLNTKIGYWNLIYSANNNYNKINCYSSSFISHAPYGSEVRIACNGDIFNCQFGNSMNILCGKSDIYNCLVTNSAYFFRTPNNETKIEKVSVYGGTALVYFQTNGAVIKNVEGKNFSSVPIYTEGMVSDAFLVDCILDNWLIGWYGGTTAKLFRQYTFNLNVLNGEITDFVQNANVTLYKDNVKVYSGLTNSSGMIPTQTLTYGYYQQSTGNTIQNATSPYYLVISHPDWQTYVSRFYITEPLRLTVSMQGPIYTGYTEAEKSDYTTIILFVISLILCIIGLALTVPLLPLISLTISVINIIFLSEPSIFNILLIALNVIFTIIALVRVKTKNN